MLEHLGRRPVQAVADQLPPLGRVLGDRHERVLEELVLVAAPLSRGGPSRLRRRGLAMHDAGNEESRGKSEGRGESSSFLSGDLVGEFGGVYIYTGKFVSVFDPVFGISTKKKNFTEIPMM